MTRKLILPGGILWLSGMALSIIGMNIKNDTGSLIAVIGNVLFSSGSPSSPRPGSCTAGKKKKSGRNDL